jgi:hypothetical protein
MRRDGAVDATAHRNQDAAWCLVQPRARGDGAAESPSQRVGRQLGGVDLPGAKATQLRGNVGCPNLRRLEHGRTGNQTNRSACRSAGSAAAGSCKARIGNAVALNADRNPHQISADSSPGDAVVSAFGNLSLPARVTQMILKALVSHDRPV